MAERGVQGLSREQTFKGRHRAAKLFVFSSDLTQPKLPCIRPGAFGQIENPGFVIVAALADAMIADTSFPIHSEVVSKAKLDVHVRR